MHTALLSDCRVLLMPGPSTNIGAVHHNFATLFPESPIVTCSCEAEVMETLHRDFSCGLRQTPIWAIVSLMVTPFDKSFYPKVIGLGLRHTLVGTMVSEHPNLIRLQRVTNQRHLSDTCISEVTSLPLHIRKDYCEQLLLANHAFFNRRAPICRNLPPPFLPAFRGECKPDMSTLQQMLEEFSPFISENTREIILHHTVTSE